jgi:hypothetical protein
MSDALKSPHKGKLSSFKEVKVIDDRTFTISLAQPYAPGLYMLAQYLFVVPPGYVQKVGDAEYNLNPVGSGPYKLDKWVKGQEIIMSAYDWVITRLPRRWCLSMSQSGITIILLLFWFLFRRDQAWVSVAFFLFGSILAVLLISQFWTLATRICNIREGKRVFSLVVSAGLLGGGTGGDISREIVRILSCAKIHIRYSAGRSMRGNAKTVSSGFIVEPLDTEAIAEKFKQAYELYRKGELKVKHSFEDTLEFSWEALTIKLAELFTKIVQERQQ